MKLSPAQYVIHVFGGARPAARAIDRDAAAVLSWVKNERIPAAARLNILKAAKKLKLDITSHDLDFGRTVRKE